MVRNNNIARWFKIDLKILCIVIGIIGVAYGLYAQMDSRMDNLNTVQMVMQSQENMFESRLVTLEQAIIQLRTNDSLIICRLDSLIFVLQVRR